MSKQRHSIYRRDYKLGSLDESTCPTNPFELLGAWIDAAVEKSGQEPTMVLSTVGQGKRPSSRVVLLKGLDARGLHFFTNYQSRKGRELESNPYAALNFYWEDFERQVRLEGKVDKMPENESDEYFKSRPLESRINAIISPQSEPVSGRDYLENLKNNLRIEEQQKLEITRPDFWGGYIFSPEIIEFWQGRPGRLNDRILYSLQSGMWKIGRLAP